ncbi:MULTISPECIES: flagellar basal body L-ring protein FlgH [Xanthomonas]|uniref:Flagellar L-ring protein n=2 Tax=Xanthomonas TaxID=338 RepID=A0AA46SYB2_9XANT|nr:MULTISPECIES: flagellar basal body L-ring protein FlgH [Xanthomonas]KAA8918702.1 flagellar basal body L-ring protein [Xanthomonas sontii]KAB7766553.1 flagellar basal body L-ring protein FlgH [Xanthomonas sp. LMG 12461]KAB7768694.1 flagellar basal body L-ring protein [Xanthomonas sp. LMG 12462]KAB7777757.1 flagellar basal body L-ring protein [Xanthomonas sp. LMG 12460]MCW0366757.1 Flagellar L-ring protein [Xanthomonas sacchari]
MSRLSSLSFSAALLLPVLLGGCAGLGVAAGDVRPYAPMAPIVPVMAPQAQPTAGAIYAAGPGLQLYSDRRARDVGDLLTITLVESTNASSTANTSISKKDAVTMATPTLLGAPLTVNGTNILNNSTSGDRSFAGKGNTAQSNTMQGSITVTVMQRLPNGNLVIQGQKNLRLNQGDELVQVQGVVRAADIAPDNTIPSSKVAEARIAYGGRGAVAQSNAMGWLSRFFNSRISPY